MKSSEGIHIVGLDHVRALAVFLVFTYHFLIALAGKGGTLPGSFSFPGNALLFEGHTGVALFMTLSGYLFSRLTEGREIDFTAFRYNRFIRLAPLLGAILAIRFVEASLQGHEAAFAWSGAMLAGLIFPNWPNGAWSVVTEMHFYLLFPLLVVLLRHDWKLLLLVVAGAAAFRAWIYVAWSPEDAQYAAYWTIIGRIDQFVLGMVAARCAAFFQGRHRLAAAIALAWVLFWYGFASVGGFYAPDKQWLWIGLPSVEGAAYAALIAYYEKSFRMPADGFSGFVGKIGEWSYSFYLLHFFVVAEMARGIDRHVLALDNFYVALLFSLPCFLVMVAAAGLSYRWFETPFLRKRVRYLRGEAASGSAQPKPAAARAAASD
ncbi:MAG TPA: acyltransferase [Allosphingosinicella sp.]